MREYNPLIKANEQENCKRFNGILEINEGNYGLFSSYESNDLRLIRVFGENSSEKNYKLKSNLN